MFGEVEVFGKLAKNVKRFNTIASVLNTSLIALTAITEGNFKKFIICLPVRAGLSDTSATASLGTANTQKFFEIFSIKKQKKALKLVTQESIWIA